MPVRFNPKVMAVPDIDILEGVAATVAEPPDIDNAKSAAVNAPAEVSV